MSTRRPIADDLVGLLANNAAANPAAPAFFHGGATYTWARLEDLAARAAGGLRALGVGPGDRVALWLPNVPAWPILQFACARLGAIVVSVNTRFRAVEVADIVHRSGATVLACAPNFKRIDFLGILAEIDPAALAHLRAVVTVGDEGAAPPAIERLRRVPFEALLGSAAMDESHAGPAMGCNIFTTSGTTKAPKFVLHRQGAVMAHNLRVARAFGFTAPETVAFGWLPMCGVFGFNVAMSAWAAGKPLVLQESFDVEEAVRLIAKHRPTALFGGDDMAERLLDAVPGERPFPSVGLYGFANFNPALADMPARAAARGLTMIGLYGMSEVQALFARWNLDEDPAIRALGGGRPVSPLANARTRDPESGELLPPGQPGELELLGPSLMVGYYGDAEATAAAFTEDRYLRTGDLGHTTDDGGFVFLGRMGDVLRLAGFLVNPAEIEAHLQTHPSVAGAQVVGATHVAGTRAVAFVVAENGAAIDEAALIEHCRRGLANFKTPARVVAVEAFPTTPSANGPKIQRARLREMAARLLD
ncbi:MAG: AMP-binding protein [Rhodospirillales bacterium]|nr:MAG: AMP-binding protein [Rhodospirillales bacterium]